ncbi:hypothetical protein BASA81_004423 [Batrachochytrium salamandrivorans]|nr:hypothetical protein BASA81_004423 [Batrachochytrium salamandrivorans]
MGFVAALCLWLLYAAHDGYLTTENGSGSTNQFYCPSGNGVSSPSPSKHQTTGLPLFPPLMDLQQVELLCQKIYGQHSSPEDRKHAHEELLFLQTSASYVDQCVVILTQSKDLPTLMFACQSLNLVMKRDWQNIPPQTRFTLQQFLIDKTANHAAAFDSRHFLTKKLVQTLCHLTRRGWCEDVRLHGVVDTCLFWMSQKRTDLALRVMSDLVLEFDQAKSQSAFGDDSSRRAFQSFRELEGGLFRIFSTSVELVWGSAQLLPHTESVLCESLRCLLSCLQFDFSGTGSSGADSESTNFSGNLVLTSVYLPKTWIPMVGSERAINDLFQLYTQQFNNRESAFGEEIASLVLQCLTLVAGIRRTASGGSMMTQNEANKTSHLYALLRGVEQLCKTRQGFADSEDCLHNFCRLLARVRIPPQQLVADVELCFYYEQQWLPTAREFSIHCLLSWLTVSPHSVGYLFDFWKSISTQLEVGKKVQLLRPLVFTYLQSRMDMCEVAAIGMSGSRQMRDALRIARECRLASDMATASCDLDEIDPLKNEEVLLDEIASICNFVSGQPHEDLLLQGIGQVFELGNDQDHGMQAKKAFAMYFVGCLISVRGSEEDSNEDMSGELALCAKAFKAVSDATHPERVLVFEQSILYFLQCFHYMLLESKTRSQIASLEMKQQQSRRYMRLSTSLPSNSPDIMPALMPPPRGIGSVASVGVGSQQLALDDFYVKSGRGAYLKPLTMKRSNSTLAGTGLLDDMLLLSETRSNSSSLAASVAEEDTFEEDLPTSNSFYSEQLANEYVKSQTVSRRIGELIGVPGDELALMNIAVQHLFNVLLQTRQNHAEETILIERSLSVLKHLLQSSSVVVTSMSAIPKMVKSGTLFLDLEFIQNLLRNATPNMFPLLTAKDRGKSRTTYMSILAFLFFLQLDSAPPSSMGVTGVASVGAMPQSERVDDAFCQFMLPLSQQQQVHDSVSFLRDIRGVFQSASEFHQYELCFAWLFLPHRIQLLQECGKLRDAQTTVALLKLLVEVASNRDARISFPSTSVGPSLLVTEFVSVLLPVCQMLWDDVSAELRRQESKFMELWNLNHVAQDLSQRTSMNMSALHAMVEELGQEETTAKQQQRQGLPVRFTQGVVGMGFTLEHSATVMKQVSQICLLLTKLGKLCPSVQFRELQALVLSLGLSCDPLHLSSYAKCEQHFVSFCYHISESQPMLLTGLSPAAFARLVAVLGLALQPKPVAATSGILSTHAAYAIETLASMRSRALLFSLMPYAQNTTVDLDAYYCLRPQAGFVKSELTMLHRIHRGTKVYQGRDLKHCLQVFALYESQEPLLFSDLFHSLLDRVLTVSESELTNLYALTRPLLSLAATNQLAVKEFSDSFVNAQAANRQRMTAEQLAPILRLLTVDSTNSIEVCEFLRRQEEYTKDLCKSIRRFRDFYSNL